MIRTLVAFAMFVVCFTAWQSRLQADDPRTSEMKKEMREHSAFNLEHWTRIFPVESFERTDGPRRFKTSKPDDPIDLWKACGPIVSTPADLCCLELVRQRVGKKHDLGISIPTDIFVWKQGPPEKSYLTKLGGVPHREADKPWPRTLSGKPSTFLAQFCFVDSKDIVSDKLPGDVMLVFLEWSDSYFHAPRGVQIEWSSIELSNPLKRENCPKTSFSAPELSGVIYRNHDYPESHDFFEQEGHMQSWLFAEAQGTKIGRSAWMIQGDLRNDKHELLCTLSSLELEKYKSENKWPLTDLEFLPKDRKLPMPYNGWSPYELMFGDVGCLYFLIDRNGKVRCEFQCY